MIGRGSLASARLTRHTTTALLALLLVGCTGHSLPPVTDRTEGNERTARYRVQPGDTLYSIAWRYRLDVNALARANRLPSPYTLHPGASLTLAEKPAPVVSASKPRTEPSTGRTSKPPAPKRGTAAEASQPPTRPSLAASADPLRWRWPTSAPVLLGYGVKPPGSPRSPRNKGIDYRLSPSHGVRAAAEGDVVYAGAGLGGFETLMILRHTDDLLSAYSFDGSAALDEGDRAKAGARLADNPGRASGRSRLHFEIRREGDPVDPSTLIR